MGKVSNREAIARTAQRIRIATGNKVSQEEARKEVIKRIERQERRNRNV